MNIEKLRQSIRRLRQLRPIWSQIIMRFIRSVFLWVKYVPFQKHLFVKIPVSCRLGNQMFITTFGMTIQKRIGKKILFYTYDSAYCFQDIDSWIYKRFEILTFPIKIETIIGQPEKITGEYIDKIKSSLVSGNVMLSGYFESLQYIDISFAKSLHERPLFVKEILTAYYGDFSKLASIHVRRGDFVNMGVSIGTDYYLEAMRHFPDDTKFIVISDDIEWCKENIKTEQHDIVFANKHYGEKELLYLDLFLPSLCLRGNILSCSSFSWWGSALTDSQSPVRVMPIPWWSGERDKPLYFEGAVIIDTTK